MLALSEPGRAGPAVLVCRRGDLLWAFELLAADRDFLHARCQELDEQFPALTYALPRGPIHGDAHTGNLLTDRGSRWCCWILSPRRSARGSGT